MPSTQSSLVGSDTWAEGAISNQTVSGVLFSGMDPCVSLWGAINELALGECRGEGKLPFQGKMMVQHNGQFGRYQRRSQLCGYKEGGQLPGGGWYVAASGCFEVATFHKLNPRPLFGSHWDGGGT